MDSGLLGGLVAVAAVVVVTLLFRAARGSTTTVAPPPPTESWADDRYTGARDEDDDDEEEEAGPDDSLVVAVTSDGHAFVPDRHVVLLIPPEEEGEAWKVGAGIKSATRRAEKALSMSWRAGDLRGARVVRGDADEAPWRLETLGRDGEYIPCSFESRDAAEAARELLERMNIVKLGEDEDGRPMPPSAEQFAEARRIFQETEAELGMAGDEDPR